MPSPLHAHALLNGQVFPFIHLSQQLSFHGEVAELKGLSLQYVYSGLSSFSICQYLS